MLEAGGHGESGASVPGHAGKELDGGAELPLIHLVLKEANIASVILSRLKLARQLIVKVFLEHIFICQICQAFKVVFSIFIIYVYSLLVKD